MQHVYVLKKGTEVVYVGETKDPQARLYQHTCLHPGYRNGCGKFYKQDVTIEVIKSFADRKDAKQYEKELQQKYSIERGESKWSRVSGLKRRKLTLDDARKIRALHLTNDYTMNSLANMYDVNVSSIWYILNNKTYKE